MKRARGKKSPEELAAWYVKRRAFREAHEQPPREAHTGVRAIDPESVESIARSLGMRVVQGKVG